MTVYHDQARDLLIYPPSAGLPVHLLPEGRQVGDYFAVPRTLRNSQILRYYNFPVVPVITDQNYDWPIEPGRQPLPHQKLYANFQVMHPRCFNLGDPGTMKTLSSLWAADFVMRHHPGFRWLIICPLTIIESGWATTIFKNFLGRRTCEILHGPPEKRLALLNKDVDLYLINYEGPGIGAHTRRKFELDGFSKALHERADIRGVIIDEARAYGDATSKRSRLARLIFGQREYMWELCGSPTPQMPTDCYGMAKLLNNAYSKSFQTFQQETEIKVSLHTWVPRADGYEKARQLLTPAIRFALDDIWSGPPQTVQLSEVDFSEEQKRLAVDLKRDLTVVVKSGKTITALNEGAARLKLLQICCGAIYDGDHFSHTIDMAPRLAEIKRIIDSTERKVVIFVNFTGALLALKKHLTEWWKKSESYCDVIYSAVKDRATILRKFEQDPKFRVLIVDPSTTAHGVNEMVAADTGIWMTPPDKTDLWIQGNARIRRPGQRYPSTIFQLASTKTEKEIYKRLENNTNLMGAMLDVIRRGEL